jgi:hypothetical protein
MTTNENQYMVINNASSSPSTADTDDTDNTDDTDDQPIDVSWIEQFEKEEYKYAMFYPEKIKELTVSILYINGRKELEKISVKKMKLEKHNEIQKNDLLALIKQHDKLDNIKYKILSILVYNFTLQNDELKSFLKNSGKYDFMTNLKQIDTYQLESSIECISDINNLYILFYQDSSNTSSSSSTHQTKRVRFNLTNGKTRRKR